MKFRRQTAALWAVLAIGVTGSAPLAVVLGHGDQTHRWCEAHAHLIHVDDGTASGVTRVVPGSTVREDESVDEDGCDLDPQGQVGHRAHAAASEVARMARALLAAAPRDVPGDAPLALAPKQGPPQV